MNFAEIIKSVRHQALLSQADFARAIGVSFCTVNRWETGKSVPNYKTMTKIRTFCQKKNISFDLSDEFWEVK